MNLNSTSFTVAYLVFELRKFFFKFEFAAQEHIGIYW